MGNNKNINKELVGQLAGRLRWCNVQRDDFGCGYMDRLGMTGNWFWRS